jgi:hypothetical protein
MDYIQRLTVLQTLHAEINLQLSKEIAEHADEKKINEHHHLLKQIDVEIDRIEKMRSYKPAQEKK